MSFFSPFPDDRTRFNTPHRRVPRCLLEPVQNLAKGHIAALKSNSSLSHLPVLRAISTSCTSKCSHTPCMLRFFARFCLALHPLSEILNRFLVLICRAIDSANQNGNDQAPLKLKVLSYWFSALLLGLAALTPCYGEQRALVLVGDQRLHIAAISPVELRRLFLGFTITNHQQKIMPLVNMADSLLYEVFLQKVVFMSANAYEKQLSTRLARIEEKIMPTRVYDTKNLIKLLTEGNHAVTYMWHENAKHYSNLKIIQILWTGHQ